MYEIKCVRERQHVCLTPRKIVVLSDKSILTLTPGYQKVLNYCSIFLFFYGVEIEVEIPSLSFIYTSYFDCGYLCIDIWKHVLKLHIKGTVKCIYFLKNIPSFSQNSVQILNREYRMRKKLIIFQIAKDSFCYNN